MDYVVEVEIGCPYCGEGFPITIDTSSGGFSSIEDCTVCCRPIAIRVECEAGEVISIETDRA
jgi:hypothetical protein